MATAMISIVDDDPSAREGPTTLMMVLGGQSAACRSAGMFLYFKRRHRAAVVIADIRVMSLDPFRRRAARDHPTLISARAGEHHRTRAIEEGVFGYLTKPFDERDLLTCIERALVARNGSKGNVMASANGRAPAQGEKSFSIQQIF